MASPDEMAATMLQNLPAKTGKSLTQWHSILRRSSLEKHGQLVGFLKNEHGVTHGFANLIVSKFLNPEVASAMNPVDAQYSGAKEGLREIYDAFLNAVVAFGPDVEIAPKKAYVSLRRKKQFGLVQPSTKTRVDIGLNLPGDKATERLEKSGSFNAMVSHRVRVTSVDDIDNELIGWIKRAYQRAG